MSIKMGISLLPPYKPRTSLSKNTKNLGGTWFLWTMIESTPSISWPKIRPLISMVQGEFVKMEPEECNSVDKQIILLKTKYLSIRQYNPKKPKKCVFKKLVQAGISGFIYGFYVYDGKNSAELGDGKLVIYRNVHKLLQSCVMIFLATKIIKCSLTGWQRWISYITLDWKDYMLLVQFNWPFARFSSWCRQRLHEKWQRHYGLLLWNQFRNNDWSGSIIAWLVLHQTLLELSQLGCWKDGVERRRWEKTSHVLKMPNNTGKACKVLTWQTCCFHCIGYHAT